MADVGIPSPQMLIGGELRPARSGAVLDSVNPSTEDVVGQIPDASTADVSDAVEAAQTASPAWAALGWEERGAVLRKWATIVGDHLEELATLDSLDGGNPLTSMKRDVQTAVDDIAYFAGIAGETKGQTIPSGPGELTSTEFVPYPVVGRIVPFNHPLKFAAAKSAAPLAAGASVILKPGEQTSLSALRLAELSADVFPPGVFNVVTGPGAVVGAAIAEHPGVPRVAFTGSVRAGQAVASVGVTSMKHVTLELGGKNPFIVFPDVDVDEAANGAMLAMNMARSMGQSCGSTSRVLVHRSIYEQFVASFAKRVEQLTIGDPLDPKTQVGPLAFKIHYERVLGYVESGLEQGARLVTGGKRPEQLGKGFFLAPTILADVQPDMKVAQEEIFGPVVCVIPWDEVDSMIAVANGVDYGLTANIWTRDISDALRTARRIEAGYVTINGTGARPTGAPFGGFKNSGYGKEGSLDELLSYGRFKSTTVHL